MLIILTNVEKVCINLGQKDEEPLGEITTEQAKTYMEEGHFGIYNMLPKFRASVDFVEECEGRSAYITSFDKVTDALKGKTGTVIRQFSCGFPQIFKSQVQHLYLTFFIFLLISS